MSKRPYVLVGKRARVARFGMEIFTVLRITWKIDVKCTQICSQSVWREVTNCRTCDVDENWIIILKWTLKVLVCGQFQLAQDNGDFQAVLVAIMISAVPKKPWGFHLSFHKLSVFQQILLLGKKDVRFKENIWVVQLFNWRVLSAESTTNALKISSSILKKT